MAAMEKNNKTINVPHLRFPEFSGEWKKCTIGDFGNVITGNTPPTAEDKNYDNGTHLWASPADLGTTKYIESTQTLLSDRGFEKSRSFPANSILVTCIGSTIGKMGMSKTEMASNQQINTIVPVQHDANFVYYAVQSRFPRYLSSIAVQAVPILSKSSFEKLTNYTTARKEQIKIGNLLSLIDERIDTQKKIIEDLKKLKDAITHSHYRNEMSHSPMVYIGQYITQVSKRNKDAKIDRVLSVSNKYGFINQDEQFDDREVASADTSNYKVVHKGDFAYNPARINVGSVARLQEFENGIVSPMYVCFTAKKGLLPAYFELYLSTGIFKYEMNKRLEGSVRLCLTYESLCNIKIALPEFNVQKDFVSKVSTILTKIRTEERLLYLYHNCKQYLLSQMFI